MRAAEFVDQRGAGAAPRARTMMTLQRSVGNNRIANLVGTAIQTKLAVGAVDDPHEREADRVAESLPQSGSKPTGPVLRQFVMRHSLTPVQRAAATETDHQGVEANLENRITSPAGGRPLPEGLRTEMETGLGADFSGVRVHDTATDQADAGRLSAKAFTHGEHIWLGAGESADDRKLMAHELTHVVQQGGGVVRRQPVSDEDEHVSQPTPEPNDAAPGAPVAEPSEESVEPVETTQASPAAAEATAATAGPAEVPAPASTAITPPPEVEQPQSEVNLTTPEHGPSDTAAAPANIPQELTDASASETASEVEPPHEGETESAPAELAADASAESEATEVAAMPAAPDVATMGASLSSGPNLIQRQENDDDDGGILSSIRRRISSVVTSLRSGWESLSRMATEVMETIRGQLSGMIDGLINLVTSAFTALRSALSSITSRVTQLVNGLRGLLENALSTVTGMVQSIGQAVLRLDANALRAAWAQLTGLLSGANQRLRQAMQSISTAIGNLWAGVRSRFSAITSSLSATATALMSRVQSMVQGLRQRLASTWEGLRNRASQLSGVLGGILDRLRSLLSRFLSWAEGIWNSIQEQWSALSSRVGGWLQQLRSRISSAWQSARQRLTGFWTTLQGMWNRVKAWATQQVQRMARGFANIWNGIRSVNIGDIVGAILKYAPLIEAAGEAAANPESVMRPLAQSVAGQISAGMPDTAEREVREKVGGAGGGRGQAANTNESDANSPTVQRTIADPFIQRQAMEPSLDQGTIWSGFWFVLTTKWREFWTNPVDNILKILWDMVAFWETVPRDLKGLWNDLKQWWGRITGAGTGFWRHLIDLPLIILRRAVQIFMDLYPLFVVLSVVVGAIAGAVGGTVGGAILGAMAGGVAAPPGAAAGAGVGIAGGAGVGLGFALGVGEGLLAAYIAVELASFLKAWGDLSLVDQTADEQVEDLEQMVNSAIGVGVAVILLALAAIGGAIARGILSKVKLVPGGAAQRFFLGFRRGFRGGSPFRRGRAVTVGPPKVIEVDSPSQLRATDPVYQNGRWEWMLYDEESRAVFCDVYADGPSPSSPPTGGPRLTLTPKQAVLPDGTIVNLKANGFSWTPESLRLAIESYRLRFGRGPTEMGGEIDWSNLQNFQWEYAQIRAAEPGLSPEAIGSKAAAKISFGKHRISVGYGDLQARMSNFQDVTVPRTEGGVTRNVPLQNVPTEVYIEARPTTTGGTQGGGTTQ